MTASHVQEGQAGNGLPLFVSQVFPGKVFCGKCGLPFDKLSPKGLCMECDKDLQQAATVAALALSEQTKISTVSSFKNAIAEVQRTGRPLTIDMAEAAMKELGGPEGLMSRMVADIKEIRGENLTPDQKIFHDPDLKTAKGLYEIIVKLAAQRDELVGTGGDPFDGIDEKDLMGIAAQAAVPMVQADPEFRATIMAEIVRIDPQLVIDAATLAIDQVLKGPRVEVLDASDHP